MKCLRFYALHDITMGTRKQGKKGLGKANILYVYGKTPQRASPESRESALL